jgi:transglutaminase-like putative cysteine protease
MSTDSPRPQLSLDDLRRLKWLLGGLMALVSLWTVFFLDVEALTLVGLAGAVIAAALVRPDLPGRLPAWGWRLAVPAIIAAEAGDWYFSKETLPVLIRLGVLLVMYRAAGYRRQREDLQLIVLGLFLIVVAGVLTVSLGFAVLLLLFTACALGFLFVVTLIDLSENTRVALTYAEMSQSPAWARGGWPPILRRLRLVADWRLLGFATALFTAVVVMSGLLFLVIPRFEFATGFFLDRYITRKSRTGFTEVVRFGEVGELVRDESIVMRVDVPPEAPRRFTTPYWRLVVLDEYTKEGFRLSGLLKTELLRSQSVAQVVSGRRGAPGAVDPIPGVWTFYVEPGVSRFLPLPGAYGILRMHEPVPLQTAALSRLNALRVEAMAMTAFQLEGVDPGAPIRDPSLVRVLTRLSPGARAGPDAPMTLRLPQGEANRATLAALVRQISGGADLPAAEFARRATEWLRQKHAYALASRIPRGDRDDIVKWLDSEEPGFCEYFASGLTVLCRAAGHPARVVAGFASGALNTYENYYMVRNSDAHAWAEVFDGAGTWLRWDPTPRAGGASAASALQAEQEQDSSWSARFDSLRILWYRRIVNFDSRQQVQLVEDVKSLTADTGSALRKQLNAWAERLRQWASQPWDYRRLGRTMGAVAALGALGWALLRTGRVLRDRWRHWRTPGGFDPVRVEAGRQLARLGGRTEDEGTAGARAELTAVVSDLQRLRYGRRETWPEPRTVFRRARQARRLARG